MHAAVQDSEDILTQLLHKSTFPQTVHLNCQLHYQQHNFMVFYKEKPVTLLVCGTECDLNSTIESKQNLQLLQGNLHDGSDSTTVTFPHTSKPRLSTNIPNLQNNFT